MSLKNYLEESIQAIQATVMDDVVLGAVNQAVRLIIETLSKGLPVLVCGNGGSACDALHMTGELVGRFLMERKALNVIALSDNVGIITAIANDYSYDYIFSRQVEAYAKPGAVLIGLSTSGNSANVLRAFEAAPASRGLADQLASAQDRFQAGVRGGRGRERGSGVLARWRGVVVRWQWRLGGGLVRAG